MPHNSELSQMWTNFNNSFTDKLQKNVLIRSTTSPQNCCRITVRNLNVQLCYFTARYVIVTPLSTVEYTTVASVFHGRRGLTNLIHDRRGCTLFTLSSVDTISHRRERESGL